jgi:hypothetical protein
MAGRKDIVMRDFLRQYDMDERWLIYPAACLGAIWLAYGIWWLPNVGAALLLGVVFALLCFSVVVRTPEDRKFLVRLFLGALGLRWALGALIYSFPALNFLGLDASTYDAFGNVLCQSWHGLVNPNDPWLIRATSFKVSGWGMLYYVAAIYYLIGQNPLAVQLITAALGASSAVIIYKVVMLLFQQPRIARTSALLVAFSPSMILWSSQALKDAPIVFCLSLCALYTLKLREKFSLKPLALLLVFLFCVYSLRHYAFYILFISIAGALLMGTKNFSPVRILQGGLLVLVLGFAFVFFGANDVAKGFDLKDIQARRAYGAKEAKSGYGGDVDITDTQAALTFLPIGLLYVLLSPFPWMIGVRQLIILPELLLWWLSFPLLIKGYVYAIRHRLKESFVLCLFTVGLTLVYALYQTNVGTAYRHRAQMYIFFFIFISIGWEMRRTRQLIKQAEKARWYEQFGRVPATPTTTARMAN